MSLKILKSVFIVYFVFSSAGEAVADEEIPENNFKCEKNIKFAVQGKLF